MGLEGPIGRVFAGRWRLESVLGRGGTSTVYGVTHVRDGTRGALKLLHPELSERKGVVTMLLAEARLVAAIDHPGTVAVLDEGEADDGSSFLVFERLVGQTLEELRQERGGRVPLDEVMRIGDAVMDALRAVHEAGVVHRDVKPHNVFVLEGGGVKLLDFGFAKLRGYTADAAQELFGTPSYMPPEQAMGLAKKVDAQSDVWSLGATLFHVLSGQSVHIANDMKAMLLASSSARPRSLADAAPELSSKVVAVVDRALSYMKAERWPDMVSMRTAWQEAHPHWLSTLPPPRFTADPAFLDPSLLEAASTPSEPRELFDPRELLAEPVPAQKHPGALPRRATPPPAPPRAQEPARVLEPARAPAALSAQVRGAALSGNERPHEPSASPQHPTDEARSPVTTAAAQRSRRWKPVAVAAGVTVLVAALGATMTELGPWYQSLRQPAWKPPDAWFGPGWTVIFACAAASASTAWRDVRDRPSRERVVVLFTANAFFNLLWSALFFRFQRPDWALYEVVLLWLSILVLIVYLARRSRPASLILLPYLAWVTFAGTLNAAVVSLNPHL